MPAASVDALVPPWQKALRHTSLAALGPHRLRAFLTELAEDLMADLTAERPDPAVPPAVGSRLLFGHLTDADVLARSIAVLGERLAHWPEPGRLARVLGGISAGFAAAVRDRTRSEQQQITEAAFRARRAAEARYEAVFAGTATGIAVGEVGGPIVEANPALCTMLGSEMSDIVGREFWEFDHPDDPPGTWDRIADVAAGRLRHLRLEKPLYRQDGRTVLCDIVLSLVSGPDGAAGHIVAMVEDITERRALQDRLLHQARHDPLTGLPNRTLFFERLDAALAAGRAAVCYLDLDGFKAINDALGHATGDDLLRTVAHRLADALRPHLVARMGGDEFVVLVEDGPAGLTDVARTALDTVRTPMELFGQPITISASAGVVAQDHGDSHELMKAADATLYWAKADGRGRWAVFDPERHRGDTERFALASRMPDALRRGEFVVEYQPLVRLADRRMTGVEALVRWAPPDAQRIDPATFLPLAEQSGLSVPLGRHVLREACRTTAGWGESLTVSVDVTARQIAHPGFVDDVAAVLAETGRPADRLALELAESVVMSGPAEALAALRDLRDRGVRIVVDDVGAEYSGFARPGELPVDALKLAASLISGVAHGASLDARVVGLIVELARTLGLSVGAQSVRSAAQAQRLAELGCETAQGCYFGHALGPDEAAARAADPVFTERPTATP